MRVCTACAENHDCAQQMLDLSTFRDVDGPELKAARLILAKVVAFTPMLRMYYRLLIHPTFTALQGQLLDELARLNSRDLKQFQVFVVGMERWFEGTDIQHIACTETFATEDSEIADLTILMSWMLQWHVTMWRA